MMIKRTFCLDGRRKIARTMTTILTTCEVSMMQLLFLVTTITNNQTPRKKGEEVFVPPLTERQLLNRIGDASNKLLMRNKKQPYSLFSFRKNKFENQ
mmetsp:Transcript_29656/g.44759  ORF Transcript_29656/g.44759 Transcript_29656/m.44759 type:complete len:97 (+) Transcript_29656:1126-1416(+)